MDAPLASSRSKVSKQLPRPQGALSSVPVWPLARDAPMLTATMSDPNKLFALEATSFVHFPANSTPVGRIHGAQTTTSATLALALALIVHEPTLSDFSFSARVARLNNGM